MRHERTPDATNGPADHGPVQRRDHYDRQRECRTAGAAVVGMTGGFDLAVAESWDGDTVAFVLPRIPDDAPEEIREGIARRRITAVEGTCPCGAGLTLPNHAARRKAARAGE